VFEKNSYCANWRAQTVTKQAEGGNGISAGKGERLTEFSDFSQRNCFYREKNDFVDLRNDFSQQPNHFSCEKNDFVDRRNGTTKRKG
jgi:hypothetical protein